MAAPSPFQCIVGSTGPRVSSSTTTANRRYAYPFTASASGSALGIFYSAISSFSATAKLRCAIYADSSGSPGARVAYTNEIVGISQGLNFAPFASPVALTAGTVYWISFLSDTALTVDSAGSSSSGKYIAQTYGVPADPFGTPAGSMTITPVIGAYVALAALGVTKANLYAVLAPPVGLFVSKANVYAVLSTEAPTVTGTAPSSGSSLGGASVTITGTGFVGITGVTFGGDAATNVVAVSDTTITCSTPAHAVGAVDVVVTGANGSGTLAAGYTFAVPSAARPQVACIT